MKLARMLRVRACMSSRREGAEDKIRELFGETQQVDSKVVEAGKQLLKKREELLAEGKRVRNYHQYEYYRGEDLIENIPYLEINRYTLRDKLNEDQDRERRAVEELQPIGNHAARSRLIREKLTAYHDKQKKFELQEFERYLSEYPGTVRGPRPEDDWEAYRAYGLKKIPKILVDEINEERKIKEEIEASKAQEEVEEDEKIEPHVQSAVSILNFFSKDRDLIPDDDDEDPNRPENPEDDTEINPVLDAMRHEYDQPILDEFKTDVPLIPNYNFESYQHFVNHWMNWLNFRNSYTQFNLKTNLQKLSQRLMRLTKSLDYDPQNKYMEIKANIPSLCRYYRCLPKEMQDHPGMKDIYLGLQYSSPDFTYEEKEEMINYTCRFLLPFDDISNKVMQDYISKSRVYPTPYLFDKIFTISPEFTWDLKSFLQEIRRQELKGETSNQNKDLRFPEPPEVHKMWEEGAANLPVDYYDNEDGFWESIISEKLRRYDEYKPMLKTRKYFTH